MEHRATPYPHTVVRHRGARRMSLRVGPAGVRLTIPPRTPAAQVDAFLRASRGWVEEQRDLLPSPAPALADGARVALLDDQLDVVVRPGAATAVRVRRQGSALLVSAPPGGDIDAAVERWYRREARTLLTERSRALATQLGVHVAAVTIRDPRSRWGSCSSRGRISYSWRLMLAPGSVLAYVVAHEVCHLVRPDHSPAFWSLLRGVDPGTDAARRWLRDHGRELHRGPAWRSHLTA